MIIFVIPQVNKIQGGYNGEQKLEVIAERLARLGQKGTKFNYEKATITAFGESIHSYFTDIIKYSFATDIN